MLKSLKKFVPEFVCAVLIAGLAVLLVKCDQAEAAEAKPSLNRIAVCIQQPDGTSDVWAFMSYEKVLPIPAPALANSVQQALRYQARIHNDVNLILAAEYMTFATPDYARLPSKPKRTWGDEPIPGYSCQCAEATFNSKGQLSGCTLTGCLGCYICNLPG